MERVEKFFRWFKNLGGQIPEEEKSKFRRLFRMPDPPPVSSFKDNPEEVKAKHNYVFNDGGRPEVPLASDDFLNGFPDVNNLRFVKK